MNQTVIVVLFAVFVGLQVGDVLTTVRALDNGATEANKIVQWVMARIGVIPALIVVKVLAVGAMLAAVILAPELARFVLAALDLLYLAVVINNVRVIRG